MGASEPAVPRGVPFTELRLERRDAGDDMLAAHTIEEKNRRVKVRCDRSDAEGLNGKDAPRRVKVAVEKRVRAAATLGPIGKHK